MFLLYDMRLTLPSNVLYAYPFLSVSGSRGFYSEAHFVNPILCERFFQEDLIPILLKIFQVRDLQIRSVLLR